MNAIAIPPKLREIVQEYEAKVRGGSVTRTGPGGVVETIAEYPGAEAEAAAFSEAVVRTRSAAVVGTGYGGDIFRGTPGVSAREIERSLLLSAWRSVYEGLNIAMIATARDKKSIDLMLENPPAFTIGNIRDKFGDYLLDQRFHALRGLAETFSDLDPAFRSHEKMKIGVKGLPKRVIITGAMGRYSFGTHGSEQLRDVIRVYQIIRGEPDMERAAFENMKDEARSCGEADWPGGRIKAFANGNAHVFFSPEALRRINLALAEFYGDVLPDSPEAREDVRKRTGTDVSKDLQFYATPPEVARQIVERMPPAEGSKVLEPSCGEGAIMDAVVAQVHEDNTRGVLMSGIEVHFGRAEVARRKGYSVLVTNFLDHRARPEFDRIYMNPPFYGRHYLRHIRQAIDLLVPGGVLVALLPASAYYDHGELPGRQYDPAHPYHHRDAWRDLPPGSFRASGTNVSTGIWTYQKARS